ncbi:fork head domain-containing protein FD4 [Copidosoma floridanum]|uniref:fork head domain-containing protein FD4 n=1 Tax=Copidosoma floridanum TaxID=29053 RepID=UPI0006C9D97B|nr:fork head domain-containing protein FD4 [Copidosoma floridanum]
MCSNESPPPSKESHTDSMSVENSIVGLLPSLEHYRLQLYHYAMAERIRLAQHVHPHNVHPAVSQTLGSGQSNELHLGSNFTVPSSIYPLGTYYPRNMALSMALLHPNQQQIPEEPKPQHSYIGLIAMAILSSPEKKLVLSDIYQHILENYPYFRRRGPGWRNSIRHNLSLNDCFVKSGRSANGKGHYWAIHQANLDDFRRGDFRRRKAQRKVRRHMGLAVDEEPDSPSPPPLPTSPTPTNIFRPTLVSNSVPTIWSSQQYQQHAHQHQMVISQTQRHALLQPSKKRQFDVASLLAPDDEIALSNTKSRKFSCSEDEQEPDQDEVEVDVVAESEKPVLSLGTFPISDHHGWKNSIYSISENHYFSQIDHSHVRNYHVSTNTSTSSSL